MTDLSQQYLQLLQQYLFARDFSVSGIELSTEEGDIYLDKLDAIWFQMNPAEIEEIEKYLASSDHLNLADMIVGDHILPRK